MTGMRDMKRARRRMDLERMKRRAAKAYPWMKNPGVLANHLACCSCFACGNPRRHTGQRSMQERRAGVGRLPLLEDE